MGLHKFQAAGSEKKLLWLCCICDRPEVIRNSVLQRKALFVVRIGVLLFSLTRYGVPKFRFRLWEPDHTVACISVATAKQPRDLLLGPFSFIFWNIEPRNLRYFVQFCRIFRISLQVPQSSVDSEKAERENDKEVSLFPNDHFAYLSIA